MRTYHSRFDEVGNTTAVKSPRGFTTTYVYDDADRKIEAHYPDSTSESWEYRDDGRLYQHTDGRGREITYRYDADDRLYAPYGSGYVAIDYPTANETDVNIARDMDGLVEEIRDASGTTTNTYYPSQKPKEVIVSAGSSKTITYQYNNALLVSSMQVTGENAFTYSYNGRNQLSSVTNPNSVQVSFTYDNAGRRTRITDPGSYVEYVYNARNWLTDVRNRTTGGTTRYDATYAYNDGSAWDNVGNPLKRTENVAGSTYTTTLRYDAVYRETEETKRDSSNNVVYSLTYGYDECGNRTSRTLGGTTTTYTFDDNNKLLNVNGTLSCSYDGNGNLTSTYANLPSQTMWYNDSNYLTRIRYGGGPTDDYYYYAYDGRRYRASFAGAPYRYYLYDGVRVLEELDQNGSMQARYTTEDGSYYGALLHLYRPTGTLSRFPMYDSIGTVRGLVDASGTVTDTYELDTFGRSVSNSGTTPNPYRFGGAWGYITDPSGMLQLGVRYYWPELGRFVSEDPISDGTTSYAYASSSPVTRADPNGLWEAQGNAALGIGVSFGFGRDPDGRFYCRFRIGVGIGAGATFNPSGHSPAAGTGMSGGSFFGAYGSANASTGFWSGGSTSSGGLLSDAFGHTAPYYSLPGAPSSTYHWPPTLGAGFNYSFGYEGGFYGF